MPKVKRRLPNTIQKLQALNTYTPVVRSRKNALSLFDNQLMHDAFIPNEQCAWVLTSNCKVVQKKGKYQIVALKRGRAHDTNGKRIYSTTYDNAIDSENDAFEFRYNLESKKSRISIDEYKTKIRSSLSGTTIDNTLPQETPRKRIRSLPSSRVQQYSMSGSLQLNLLAGKSSNPKNSQPNSSSLLDHRLQSILNKHAATIQRVVRNREVKRGARMMKRTIREQTYRQSILKYLSFHIKENSCDKLLLGSEDPEIMASFSLFDKYHARTKAVHIADALQVLIKHTEDNKSVTWIKCCEVAIQNNYNQIKRARTIADWYLELHSTTLLRFRRSERGRAAYFMKSPFAEDESLTSQFKSWARNDLEHLSVKKAWEFINLKLLHNWTVQQLETNRISYPVSEYVISRWMKEVGFKYELHKKSYYVDRHEDEDVVSDRKAYLVKNFDLEIYEHCWIHISKVKYDSLKYNKAIKTIVVKKEEKGSDEPEDAVMEKYIEDERMHFYQDENGKKMVEMHVDDVYTYDDKQDNLPPLPSLGGSLSVRLPEGAKPVIVLGQDEAIYRSSQQNDSCWTVDGESTLRTKGLGTGFMVSAFVSRALGLGLTISEMQLSEINKVRAGQSYTDEEAATYLKGNSRKPPLKESPFIRYLNYGAGKDGYWTYRHMVMQIEDCVDCLKYIFPQYDYVFELDHSSGHASERPNGLSTNSINLGWGGKQRRMRNSVLTANDLGPIKHEGALKVGDTQEMTFKQGDSPPILNPGAPMYDILKDTNVTRKLLKDELKAMLESKGFNGDGLVHVLKTRATEAGIPITETVKQITEGYIGKPKGAAQILYDRGFANHEGKMLDGRKLTMNGTNSKDPITGVVAVDKSTSAKRILGACDDFKNEKTQLMYILDLLGVRLILTPKCHPEIAGRGVEYMWGYSKLRFRSDFNDAVASNLKQNVIKSLDHEVITKGRIRKFARKAREYKLTYALLFHVSDGAKGSVAKDVIEHLTKAFKAHRSALDADYGFINNA